MPQVYEVSSYNAPWAKPALPNPVSMLGTSNSLPTARMYSPHLPVPRNVACLPGVLLLEVLIHDKQPWVATLFPGSRVQGLAVPRRRSFHNADRCQVRCFTGNRYQSRILMNISRQKDQQK